ncbi:hypothetical protein H6F78_16340 [Coleofasciculus sp. FACHB-64]|nr:MULTISPECIES: hypothetical protein [unclassified Coleofasciculus]MBD1941256.1 hypothetical protein [Coleofasciculus sp. FACHB-712]MBD2047148.1 hypothetical protein [Coleofasciculus sp. FACHB-64]MBD2086883.1 hypothetical protein [Coleofasciculus sp. FACHB-542]
MVSPVSEKAIALPEPLDEVEVFDPGLQAAFLVGMKYKTNKPHFAAHDVEEDCRNNGKYSFAFY